MDVINLSPTQHPSVAKPHKICVVGMGYIGLPTAAILASRGHSVVGIDIRPDVVETINRGEIHIHEPGLETLVQEVVAKGRLRAATKVEPADDFFLCVPTPISENQTPDLSYVRAASDAIRPHVKRGALVILESTSPPGTTERIVAHHALPQNLKIGTDVFLVHAPERVLPGRILIECVENDRIIGGVTSSCAIRARELYRTFVTGEIHLTTAVTAEITKLVENSYRDVNIAFANELSMLAESLDADPFEIIELANKHPRVNILTPGPGVGGHCISVDPWFLMHAAPERTPLIRQGRNVNESKPAAVIEKVVALAERLPSAKIGCLGLTYKSDIDDLRESPSLKITRSLYERYGERVLACDPHLESKGFEEFPLRGLEFVLEECEILVLLTDHKAFRELRLEQLESKHLVDPRGAWRGCFLRRDAATARERYGRKAA